VEGAGAADSGAVEAEAGPGFNKGFLIRGEKAGR
jgi:hypothetical protein